MSKNFATSCNLYRYVESADSDFATLLKGTCVDMTLNSFRGKAGITLLIPKDKALLKKISDLAYSDNVDDASKAADMLNAMIFKDVYKTGSDWMNSKNNIPNSLLPSQHVAVESAPAQDTIKFASGAVAKVDPKFKDSSKRRNLAVWHLISGEIPVTTDKPAAVTPFRRGKPGDKKGDKKGGYDVSTDMAQSLRFQIAVAVENIFLSDRLPTRVNGREMVGGCDHVISGPKDAFCEFTMSIFNFACNIRKDEDMVFGKILPLISFQKIDFYNLVEPHNATGNYLLPNSFIQDWWNNRGVFSLRDVMNQVHEKMANVPQRFRGVKIYADPRGVIEAINDVRTDILAVMEARPREVATKIVEQYQQIASSNSVGGMTDIFPPDLAAYYAADPLLKLVQDELRYVTFNMFESLEAQPDFDRGRYQTIINMIAEYTHETNRERALRLTNKNTLRYLIQPTEKLQEIKTFLCSTHFIYAPIPEDVCKDYPFKDVKRLQSAKSQDMDAIWNIEAAMLSKHKRLADAGDDEVVAILSKLKQLDPAAIDGKIKAELISIYSKISA